MNPETIAEVLSRLVAFDTTSRNSNLPLIDWVEDYLARLGIAAERIYGAAGEKANLWATIGPPDVPGFILSGHTDVVPVDGQVWASDPFRLRRDDKRLYARGACDMKGFLAVCLAMVPRMRERPLARPIHLAFSYDEEVGCIGARGIVEQLARNSVRQEACFVGEPTLMGVIIGHKSKRSLRVEVRGRTCHSSLAPDGVNAVEFAARLVAKIQTMARRLAAEGARDALYDVPYSTLHVGVLRGGTALNIVPDHAELLFEVRAVGADDPDSLVGEIVAYARDRLEPEMKAVDPDAGFDFKVMAGFPGLDMPADHALVKLTKSLAGRNDHAKVAFGTEAGLYQEIAGVPTVVIGPGSIDQAHKADEWIAIAELERCARFIDGLIDRCRS